MTDFTDAKALVEKIRADELLSEEEFVAHCMKDLMQGWVPLAEYTRQYPSETANKVHKRVQQGVWKRQVHYAAPMGGGAWVNLPAIRLWLEGMHL